MFQHNRSLLLLTIELSVFLNTKDSLMSVLLMLKIWVHQVILSLLLGMNFGMTSQTTKLLSYNSYMLLELLLSKYNGDLSGKKLDIMGPFLGMLFGLMVITEYLKVLELLT